MFSAQSLGRLQPYLDLPSSLKLRDRIRRGLLVADRCMRFVSVDPQNRERPFPEVYEGYRYIAGRQWAEPETDPTHGPLSIDALRDRYTYVAQVDPVFSDDVRYACAALLHLVPAWSPQERLVWLDRFLRNLSAWGRMEALLADQYAPTPEGMQQFEEHVQAMLATEPLPLLESLRPRVERLLQLFENGWGSDGTAAANAGFFLDPRGIRIRPRVMAAAPNNRVEGLSFDVIAAPHLPLSYFQQRFADHRVIFSGGACLPFQVTRRLERALPAGNRSNYTLLTRVPGGVDGRRLHSGPVNIVPEDHVQPLQDYLAGVRKQYAVTSNRCWLPWDETGRNFLWIGKPMVAFNPPAWMREQPFCRDEPLTLFGAESLSVWIDGASDAGLSGAVDASLKVIPVALPCNMEELQEGGVTKGIYPRRYPVRVKASNRCGRTEGAWETGVTYPVKLQYLGHEVGQTICSECMSPYAELRHQPAHGRHQESGADLVIPLYPPPVRNKKTWVRVFFEHNAPWPYFAPRTGDHRDTNYLPCVLRYTVRNAASGAVVASGEIQDPLSVDNARAVQHEGILTVSASPQVANADRFHHVLRNRYDWYRDQFFFHFTPSDAGWYTVEAELDLHPDIRGSHGLYQPSGTIRFSVPVREPRLTRLHWVRVVPRNAWASSTPVTDADLDQLEEWVREVIPSMDFEFVRGETCEYEQGSGDDSDRILDDLVDIQGDRPGIFVGLIDGDFFSHLDTSITDWGGAAYSGDRVAWVLAQIGSVTRSWRDCAHTVGHELGHAHPLAYDHLPSCDDPPDPDGPLHQYWQPDHRTFYPNYSCGERVYLSDWDRTSGWPTDVLRINPTEPYRLLIGNGTVEIDMPANHDIMTYCGNVGFELVKAVQLHQPFDSLY